MNKLPELKTIRLDLIDPPETASRLWIDETSIHELAASISRQGLLEPIGVKPYGTEGRVRLCYGQRRLFAMRSLGWYETPAMILPQNVSEDEARQHENNQRVQLTPVEEAYDVRRWHQKGETIQSIAAKLSRSTTWVQQRLRLANYPDDILTAVHEHGLPLAVADILADITHTPYRKHMTDEAVRHGATAAVASAWLAHYLTEQSRLERNMDTVEEVAARRSDFKIMSPCDYCGEQEELQRTKVWRLCSNCSAGLVEARTAARTQGQDLAVRGA